MDEQMTEQFLLLTGEDEDGRALWEPCCQAATAMMYVRLAGCTAEQKAAYAGAIRLATAALAAVYYGQAAAVGRPEKLTAGELRVEYGGGHQSAARFYQSCLEALAPLTGGWDGFCRVKA